MKHAILKNILLSTALLAIHSPAIADTVDERFKKLDPNKISIDEQTSDSCRFEGAKVQRVLITSTTDGEIELKPGETKYFRIKKIGDWTRSGGWYFKCEGSDEQARMKGAEYVKAVRSAETGEVTWYRVTPDI